jgi:regulator of protease activity HflC (stomatin/prohibitin superfamily)
MMGIHPFSVVVFLILVAGSAGAYVVTGEPLTLVLAAVALMFLISARVARPWEKAVVLRLGHFRALKGPGIFFLLPFVDSITMWIDTRTISTTFNAEQTLTKDTVPVDVDAVLFWRVVDAQKAALEVESYREAIFWAAQTALRDVIGRTSLATMLSNREEIDELLRTIIDHRTEPWGIAVTAVEIRDVNIPSALQDAMSMQAQAEKEREARVILADSERQIAQLFQESSLSYQSNPVALHLRAMNILLEGMRHNSTVVVVPSTAVESMGLGAVSGLTALGEEFAPRGKPTLASGGGAGPKNT